MTEQEKLFRVLRYIAIGVFGFAGLILALSTCAAVYLFLAEVINVL